MFSTALRPMRIVVNRAVGRAGTARAPTAPARLAFAGKGSVRQLSSEAASSSTFQAKTLGPWFGGAAVAAGLCYAFGGSSDDNVALPAASTVELGILDGRDAELIRVLPISGKTTKPDDVEVVIFHGGCPDGMGGAFAAYERLGDKATYIGIG